MLNDFTIWKSFTPMAYIKPKALRPFINFEAFSNELHLYVHFPGFEGL